MYTLWVHFEYYDRNAKAVLPSSTTITVDFAIDSPQAVKTLTEKVTDQLRRHDTLVIDDWKILSSNVIQESPH